MATEAGARRKSGVRQRNQLAEGVKFEPEQLSDRTTVGVFYRQAARLKDRPMIHRYVGRSWQPVTWGEVGAMTRAVAAQLVSEGVKAGDHVVLMAENRLEWLVADLGIQSAGAVTVPIYPSTVSKGAKEIVADCEAVLAIVADDETAAKLKGAKPLRKTVTMDGHFQEWMRRGRDKEEAEVNKRLQALGPDDVATIIYTSGTTGQPKGVVLAHRNFTDMARSTLEVFDIGEEDVSLSFLPMSHIFERMSGSFVGIMAGGSAYLSRGIDKLGDDLRDVRPTLMVSVPRVYEKMHSLVHQQVEKAPRHKKALFNWAVAVGRRQLKGRPNAVQSAQYRVAERLVLKPLRTRLTGGRLRFFVSGGAPLNPEIETFFWSIGIKILQGWGLTETTSGVTSNTETKHRAGTVGRAFPGVELKLAKDGEIMVKGPGVMLGYYNNRQATSEVLEDGWFKTGDIGELDKSGYLKITDRKKDLLKTAGGKYVAPQPIEARLQDEKLIERAVLIGDERPYVVALVVPDWEAIKRERRLGGKPEEMAQDEKVRAVIQERIDAVNKDLGSWESIKYFALLPADFSEEKGEMTPTLKVKRRVIQENHKDVIESMYRGKQKPDKAQAKRG